MVAAPFQEIVFTANFFKLLDNMFDEVIDYDD